MPANLTDTKINETFSQLLHMADGLTGAEATVYNGTGVSSALKLGTDSIVVGDIRITDNIVTTSVANGNVVIGGDGAAHVVISNALISGGSISDIDPIAVADGGTGAADAATARSNLGLGSIATQDADNVAITGGTLTGVTLPFGSITSRAYASFSDITDQTGNVSTPTAVKFDTTEVAGAGITMVTDGSNLTRLTFTAAGTYMVAPNLQFVNSDTNDHIATVWLRLDGTDIARSATKVSVPKTTDGGSAFFQIVFYVTVTAGQYVQVMWLPANVAVTLDHTAAAAGPPAVPAVPSAVIVSERIA